MGVQRASALVAVCVAACVTGVVDAAAQQGCEFVEGSGNLQTVDISGGPITYVSTPNLVCQDGVRIRADSAASFQSSNYVQLLGNVRFEDPVRRMTAQNAEYFTTVGRLQTHGSSELVQKTDSSAVRGDEMIYERAGPDRERSQLDVRGGRPTARLYVSPSAGSDSARTRTENAAVPYDVVADRIVLEGENYFRAKGAVEIYRDDLRAFADSVEYDELAGTLRLTGGARMILNDRELEAELILAVLPGNVVNEVEARHSAVLTAADFRLRAPLVRVFFSDGVMERLVAIPIPQQVADPGSLPPIGPPSGDADRARPVATADQFEIVADSLDMLAPGEVLDRIHAAGSARTESNTRDSLNTPDTPRLARKDWMEGDTIVAVFGRVSQDSVPGVAVPDSVRDQYRLERLMAVGRARSLYRMEPDDSARARGDRRPGIHYVTAAAITLDLDAGAIKKMEVKGRADGIHSAPSMMEARSDSLAAPRDTAGAAAAIPTDGRGTAAPASDPPVGREGRGAVLPLPARFAGHQSAAR